MSEILLNINPSISDLNSVEEWLKDEYKLSNDGFYCNWNTIQSSFEKKKFFTFHFEKQSIGFISWSNHDYYAEIDIMEIYPKFRKMGLGKKAFDSIQKYFKSEEKIALKLFCEPRESEKFWEKMGFIKFPSRGYSESELTYFKPLIEYNAPHNKDIDCADKIELWNVEPYMKDRTEPNWIWDAKLSRTELLFPILYPCNPNWNIRWSRNEKTIIEDKVKYFSRENPIDYYPFVFIEKLSEQ